MPMLDEAEFRMVTSKRGTDVKSGPAGGLTDPVLGEYERITGYRETNPAAIWHHRLELYGPLCKSCGKPLRTPRAKLCGSCMTPVGEGKKVRPWDFTILWVYLGLCALYGVYFALAYGLVRLHLGWLFIPILILDICGDRLYKRSKPARKYVPFLWVLR